MFELQKGKTCTTIVCSNLWLKNWDRKAARTRDRVELDHTHGWFSPFANSLLGGGVRRKCNILVAGHQLSTGKKASHVSRLGIGTRKSQRKRVRSHTLCSPRYTYTIARHTVSRRPHVTTSTASQLTVDVDSCFVDTEQCSWPLTGVWYWRSDTVHWAPDTSIKPRELSSRMAGVVREKEASSQDFRVLKRRERANMASSSPTPTPADTDLAEPTLQTQWTRWVQPRLIMSSND